MHPNANGHQAIREHLEHDLGVVQSLLADAHPADGELVLERLPSGEYAWLRPDVDAPIPYTLTSKGRAAIA